MSSRYMTDYETVAAGQVDQLLGPNPSLEKQGDIIEKIVVVPATVNPGAIDITDGGDVINVFTGGAGSVDDLTPFTIDLSLRSANASWLVSTGADVSLICIGSFT